jgi:hypothetical protein
MSERAAALRRLTAHVERAAGALVRARFGEFAEAAAELERADLGPVRGFAADPEAEAACHALRLSLDRLGALLGHVAGVQLALRGLDATQAALYDRSGAGVAAGRRLVREEA